MIILNKTVLWCMATQQNTVLLRITLFTSSYCCKWITPVQSHLSSRSTFYYLLIVVSTLFICARHLNNYCVELIRRTALKRHHPDWCPLVCVCVWERTQVCSAVSLVRQQSCRLHSLLDWASAPWLWANKGTDLIVARGSKSAVFMPCLAKPTLAAQ